MTLDLLILRLSDGSLKSAVCLLLIVIIRVSGFLKACFLDRI